MSRIDPIRLQKYKNPFTFSYIFKKERTLLFPPYQPTINFTTHNQLKIRKIFSIISICRDSGLQSYKYTMGWSRWIAFPYFVRCELSTSKIITLSAGVNCLEKSSMRTTRLSMIRFVFRNSYTENCKRIAPCFCSILEKRERILSSAMS